MTDRTDAAAQWQRLADDMNDAVATSMERNVEASTALMESWVEAMQGNAPDEETVASAVEGYNDAFEVWMEAAERTVERTGDLADGEDVSATEFRDLWLRSANEAFKEVMSTEAFAAANGQLMEAMLDIQAETRELREETLADAGLPTGSDLEEVGERLVELERRQHDVERKLDRVLEAVE